MSAQPPPLSPRTMRRIGTIDERFQSYNIEMIEVTGGRFWKPYDRENNSAGKVPAAVPRAGSTSSGLAADLYAYRPPIDLSSARLRKLAAALSREWLSRPDKIHAFYADLLDRFEPGKPLWNTETADAGCGGNPWAPTFLDTLGSQQGVSVKTLAVAAAGSREMRPAIYLRRSDT